jgi:hypothetical protein
VTSMREDERANTEETQKSRYILYRMATIEREQNVRVPASEQTERKFNKTRVGKAESNERRCRIA